MPVDRTEFVQHTDVGSTRYVEVKRISDLLFAHLNEDDAQERILASNIPKSSSSHVQDSFLAYATELGFRSEATGLFAGSQNPGLRPDYFCEIEGSGILLEVERGKTTINNMDMLDFWKCHVCSHAYYLFLMVPKVLVQSELRAPTRPYQAVVKRMASFFEPAHYANVRALHVFGY
jgi:hypothetical protein